jgi:hypothetical protein
MMVNRIRLHKDNLNIREITDGVGINEEEWIRLLNRLKM